MTKQKQIEPTETIFLFIKGTFYIACCATPPLFPAPIQPLQGAGRGQRNDQKLTNGIWVNSLTRSSEIPNYDNLLLFCQSSVRMVCYCKSAKARTHTQQGLEGKAAVFFQRKSSFTAVFQKICRFPQSPISTRVLASLKFGFLHL